MHVSSARVRRMDGSVAHARHWSAVGCEAWTIVNGDQSPSPELMARDPLIEPPAWCRTPATPVQLVSSYAAGWPFRSQIGSVESDFSLPATKLVATGVYLGTSAIGTPVSVVYPTQIRWPGMLANALFYMGAALGAVWCGGQLRREFRRRKNLCPSCAYARIGLAPGAACPECGHADVRADAPG